jgi:hypothetical protein
LVLAWISFSQAGRIPIDSHFISVRFFEKQLGEEERASLSNWLNFSTLRLSLFMLGTTLACWLFTVPFNLVRKIVRDLKLNNWFVEANTKRLRTLGYFFASVWAAQYILGFIFSHFTNHIYPLGITLPGSPFWFAVTSFLLSYMNQQGVRQQQEVELTV